MSLKITQLTKALLALARDLKFAQADAGRDAERYASSRTAAIHSFQLAYEMSWKTLKRFLREKWPDPTAIDRMSYEEWIRAAGQLGLFDGAAAAQWLGFRMLRNSVAHDYDEEIAEDALPRLAEFLLAAQQFAQQLGDLLNSTDSTH